MNKFTILFLTLFLALPMAMKADSAKEKKDDTRYLVGAVPEVDGKVVFSKEFQIPGMSQAQIYDTMTKWMDERLKENKNIDSRIVFSDEAKGTIAGVGEEWIVFSSSALSLDRTLVNYQITVTCKPGNCLVELEKIRFTYRETEKYKAEEWITDKYALNKAKTKLVRGLAKWRRKTVDFADDMFMDVAVAFGAPDTRPKTEKKKKEEEQQKPSVVAAAGPIVIGQGGKVTTTESAQTTIPAATLTPATPATKVASDASGYTEIDLKQIPGEVYALMGSGKLVISIGKDEFNMTNMTANAGGALGYLLADALGLKGWKKWALVAAATVGGAVLGAFLGPYVAKLGGKIAAKLGIQTAARQTIKMSSGRLWKGSAKHIFSKDHISKGIMRLGGSQRAIFNKIYKVVNSNLANAVEGSNQIHTTINGVKTTIRFYVSNGEVQNINAMTGWATRIIGKLL